MYYYMIILALMLGSVLESWLGQKSPLRSPQGSQAGRHIRVLFWYYADIVAARRMKYKETRPDIT